MKYNKILTFFLITTPLGIVLSTVLALFTVDEHGFLLSSHRAAGITIFALLLLSAVFSAVFGNLVHIKPEKKPELTLSLSVTSIIMGAVTLFDTFKIVPSPVSPSWQYYLLKLFSLIAGVIWILYGVRKFAKFKLPDVLFVIPVIYWIIRLIWIFTSLNALALTTIHILLLLTYCSVLIFMLKLAKLMNGIDSEKNFKKVLAYGLSSSALCFYYSVPHLVEKIINISSTSTENSVSNFLLFTVGIFIFTFVIVYFSENKSLTENVPVQAADAVIVNSDGDK